MKPSSSVRQLTFVALGTALIAVCSWISIPLPSMVPFTLQTFAVCLVSALLGPRAGILSVFCYILLAAAGAPVLAGFRGGPDALLGPTGGYVVGFLFTALIVGWGGARAGGRFRRLAGFMAAGILACYAFGTAWFLRVYTVRTGPVGVGAALGLCVLPYLIPDAAKIALAALLTVRLRPLICGKGAAL